MSALIFDRPDTELHRQLIAALAGRGGFAWGVDGSATFWSDALRKVPQGVVPQLVIGAPLATPQRFEDLGGTEIETFSNATLLGLWSTLRELCRQDYPDGASIVVLQSATGLELRPDTALARATLFAARAMLKAAALETRDRSPALRFNLLLLPPVEPPLDSVLVALEQIGASSFLTGGELAVRAAAPRGVPA